MTASSPSDDVLLLLSLVSFLLLVPALPLFAHELRELWRTRRLDRRRLAGLATSAFCLVPATMVEAAFGDDLVRALRGLAAWAPAPLPVDLGTALLCVLVVDFVYYWEHRLGHRVHLAWAAYHSVHHSADHYDQSVGLRVSFVDFFTSAVVYAPLVLLGFSPLLVLTSLGVVLAWQQWLHTESVGKLPWLDPWLNTPANHRVHHGRNAAYLDRNYGGVLMVWDRLFGTYAAETEPVDFGLVEPLASRHPVEVHVHGLRKLGAALRQVRGWRPRLALLFGPPERARELLTGPGSVSAAC
ncbi:MAG: sterol desaturase family protein [Myxococcota bacterium]